MAAPSPNIHIPLNSISLGSRQFSPTPSLATVTNKNDRHFAEHPLLSLTDRCTSLSQLKQIHAKLLRLGLLFDPFCASKLFSALAISPLRDLKYAQKVFDEIPQPNLYTWNTLLRAHASSEDPVECLFVFVRMLHECAELPNKFTFPFVIKAVSSIVDDANVGRVVHGMAVKLGLGCDVFILNSLIRCYGSCGNLDMSCKAFGSVRIKDVVSWNAMIVAYVQGGCPEMALEVFRAMESENVRPNAVTMVGVFSACSKIGDLAFGRMMHLYVEKNGMESNLMLNNAILDMYTKCGSMDDATGFFDDMEEKDVVSWTTMLVGYVKLGKFMDARRVFDSMPVRDIAAWNALISAYGQNDRPKEALSLFQQLLGGKNPQANETTLVCALTACAQLGAAHLGSLIHMYIKEHGIKLNCHLCTALINLYTKCGDLERALEVFHSATKKDVFVWSAMIAGLSMHGHGRAAIDTFYGMQEAGVKPNAVTFINLLSACSHAGLMEEGRLFFTQMLPVHGIEPQADHYSCMVDVLGRAGHFDEAVELINKMPRPHTASVWGALLGASCIHGNVDLAQVAFSHLVELDPGNAGAYVQMSNVYAKSGKWDKVSELRKLMRVSGLKKEQGSSTIEVNGTIHEFLVADSSHPMSTEIYAKLEEIATELKAQGYVPDKSHLLQIAEDENMKEHALYLHSEKLAIVFGLLCVETSQPIRIVKNLRICGDCHSFAKAISKLYKREILIRDRYRFHRFEDGCCSCMDYW